MSPCTRASALLLAAWGCTPAAPPPDGPLDQGVLGPFPSARLFADGHLAVGSADLPRASTPLPVERLAWRTGVSPAQVFVVRLDDVAADRLPRWDVVTADGAVRIVDTVTGESVPCFAELDAHPDAIDDGDASLLIRPLRAMTANHDHLVMVLQEAAPRPEAFDRWLSTAPEADALTAAVADAGVDLATVALAWTVPVDAGTRPLATANALPRPSAAWGFGDVDELPDLPHTWRQAEGWFSATRVLDDTGTTVPVDATGAAATQGVDEAKLWIHIPTSIAHAPEGSRPVLVFGHGFLADPGDYLYSEVDRSAVLALASAMGAVVVGTNWRGLSADDRLHAVQAAQDFGRLPELTSLLVQAQVNALTLAHLVADGGLLADPVLRGAEGQILGDPTRIVYYGISLGGIEGAVLSAQADAPFHASVLHVPGGFWSTMLERSMHWNTFEPLVADSIDDPYERQLLYAASQWFWDAVDPAAWAPQLADRRILLQESVGDEQVPNLTTRALARTLGVPQLQPAVEPVAGLRPIEAGAVGSAYVQFNPETAPPPFANRPAPRTEAHDRPRAFGGTLRQILAFLDTSTPGTLVHACDDAPCSVSNPGAPVP